MFSARVARPMVFQKELVEYTLRQMHTPPENPEVLFKSVNNNGVIVLNRPAALNALSLSMVRQIYPTLQKWDTEKDLIVIKGVGDKAFCAGGDVRAVTEAGKKGDSLAQDFFKEEYKLNYLIGTLKKPYVALIHGITMGGGVGLSVHGKYRVATEKTLFAMPETAIGLFPDVGGSYFLPRLQGKLGLFLALTGHRLKGADVLKAGIATHICHSKNIELLEKTLLDNPASSVEQILKDFESKSPDLTAQEFSLESVMPQINETFSADSFDEILRRLKLVKTKWSDDILATVHKMSPTSLKVTYRQLKEGENKSLKECLEMEYRLTQKILQANDFYEGVRSVLIDRDQKPKWNPPFLYDVDQSQVDNYFTPLASDLELKL